MPRENALLYAFNRGIISKLALARIDLKKTALAAEIQTNWVPRFLGSMMLRPGFQYTGGTRSNNKAIHIPFIFSRNDTALVEITDSYMRVKIDETPITRPSVTSTITNGTFDTDVTGWTDSDESGGTSVWATGGYLSLSGNGTAYAIRTQTVSVTSRNIEHTLTIVIERGPVILRVGSSPSDDDYISETTLGTGTHSLAFTPTGDFTIQLKNNRVPVSLVDSVAIASAGVMEIPAPWAEDGLQYIRWDQSADVIYNTAKNYQPYKIERRGTRSWSLVKYEPEDGPFRNSNISATTLTASALTGDITLTSSVPYFKTTHVGALFKIVNTGQRVTQSLTGANQFGSSIRVTGVGDSRTFTITITGTFTATVTLQRSVGSEGSWEDVTTYTTATTTTYNDALDNQIIFYRLGIKTGNYTSGTANTTLTYSLGSTTGIVRVTGYTSATSVNAAVLTALGDTVATDDWAEGAWSARRGYPSSNALYEGRLWLAGKDNIYGSVSDAYESFNDETEGDSGPLNRSIGSGPVDVINWLLALQRLIIGAELSEKSARSSSLDEILTPTNFNLKTPSTRGSTAVPPAKIDTAGVFANGARLFALNYDGGIYDYIGEDLTNFSPEICEPEILRIAVQRYPDTRIHCVLSDGSVSVLAFDRADEMQCWFKVETDGLVEDVVILPGESEEAEDKVYYCIKRTVNGSTVRYLEKWALESECVGAALNKQADSFIVYDGAETATITGLGHLEGEEVIAWGDGADLGAYTVASGQITLSQSVTQAVVGLAYQARYKSTKLAYAGGMGTPLTQRKRVDHLGLILANTHYQGLRYGADFDNMDELPLVENGAATAADYVWEAYDKDSVMFNGTYDTDSRICLEANAPRPCTVIAAVISISTHDKG